MVATRPYTSSDYFQVVELLQEANLYADTWESSENLASMIKVNPDAIIVAIENDVVIGNIFVLPYGAQISFLFRLAVKKEFRNHGIATQLLNYVENIAKKKGITELCLFADETDKELQSFYKKRGWTSSKHSYYCLWKEISSISTHLELEK